MSSRETDGIQVANKSQVFDQEKTKLPSHLKTHTSMPKTSADAELPIK